MNDNIRNLISSLSRNDYKTAKEYAKVICIQDKSAANEKFRDNMINKLSESPLDMNTIPYEISKYIIVEDVAHTFHEDRYYLSEDQRKLYVNILGMQKSCKKLKELDINYLNSTLLYGHSGTGKTMFAKYVAYKLGLPYVYIDFAQLVDSFLGGTAKHLGQVLTYIRENGSSCLLMLDEVDCISINRSNSSNSGGDGEMNRTTISLMQELDRINNDGIVIAATNRKEMIDTAFLRRFSIQHMFSPFTENENEQMIMQFLSTVGMNHLMSRCNQFTKGKSQADIMNNVIRLIAADLLQS